jgi:hypothetical protein
MQLTVPSSSRDRRDVTAPWTKDEEEEGRQ